MRHCLNHCSFQWMYSSLKHFFTVFIFEIAASKGRVKNGSRNLLCFSATMHIFPNNYISEACLLRTGITPDSSQKWVMLICFVFLNRGGYHGGSPYTLGLTSLTSYKHGVANGFGCTTVRILFFFIISETNSLFEYFSNCCFLLSSALWPLIKTAV